MGKNRIWMTIAIVAASIEIGIAVVAFFDARTALDVALTRDSVNQLVVDSAPQQQVANGWLTNDLLEVVIGQLNFLLLLGAAIALIGAVRLAALRQIPKTPPADSGLGGPIEGDPGQAT